MRTNRNLIEIDEATGTVRRYPLTDPDRRDLAAIATRHRAARAAGLPVPEVLAEHHAEPPYLVLTLMPGAPLVETTLDADGCRRLAEDLHVLRTRMAEISDWPVPVPPWPWMWQRLYEAAPTEACRRAAAVALDAPVGLLHGDLSWGNLLVDPTGRLTGVIDWDGAVMGDPAMDWHALQRNCPPAVVAHLRTLTPDVDDLDQRAEAYLGTWGDQWELWRADRHPWMGLEHQRDYR